MVAELPQGSRKVEMFQLSLGQFSTVTMLVAAGGGTGTSGFHIS